jgi:hypothetical protein
MTLRWLSLLKKCIATKDESKSLARSAIKKNYAGCNGKFGLLKISHLPFRTTEN